MKAMWNGKLIADSDETVYIEGNQYFPRSAIKQEFFEGSDLHTVCPWKGTASYFHLVDGDTRAENAAWTYEEPKDGSEQKVGKPFAGHVAFYPQIVTVTE